MNVRTRDGSVAAGLCALYVAATFAWTVVWRAGYAERSADEGIFENILWNALHGHGLRSWAEGNVPHLAIHFSPALVLLLPIYAAGAMLGVHLVVSLLTAIAGLLFHRHVARTLEPGSALPAMLAFLLCPTIVLQTFMEFHEQALAILPLTLLLIAWHERRLATILVAALALLAVREDDALLVAALGALGLFDTRRRSAGILLLAVGATWIVLWKAVVIPGLGAGGLPQQFAENYGHWGDTPGALLRRVATHPLDVIRHVLAPVAVKYLALLLAPVLVVLPFGSVLAAAMLPQLLMILFSDHGSRLFQIRMHYSIVPIVVLLFASIATLARLDAERGGLTARARRWAPIAMLGVVLLLAPGWAFRAWHRLNPYAPRIREVLAQVPDTTSVTAPGYLLNHLAARRRIALEWSEDVADVDVVVTEDSSRFFVEGPTVNVFHTPRFDSILVVRGYTKTFERDGWHVYQRGGGVPSR